MRAPEVDASPARRSPGRGSRVWRLTAWLAAAGALTILGLVDPVRLTGGLPCPFLALTGLFCPGCGATRAVHALLHGKVLAALDFNALAVCSLPLLGASWWTGRRAAAKALPAFVIWGILVVVLAFWTLRNLPVAPFARLAP